MTDANLVLGYLSPENFAGGRFDLDPGAAERAIRERIAEPLGVPVERAAWAIHEAANANMASAIHVVTVQRGLDPREHTLVAFGGAGPMHIVGIAREFGIAQVIAPPQAGVASAIGMQSTDLTAEHGVTHLVASDALSPEDAASRFEAVEAAARRKMGVDAGTPGLQVERFLDARFVGQAHEVSIPLLDFDAIDDVPQRFRARYAELYGVAPTGQVEFAALRVRLKLPVDRPPLVDGRGTSADLPPLVKRPAWFGPEGAVPADVVQRSAFGPGVALEGPVIVEGPVETTVVPPGWSVHVDPVGSLVIEREA